MCVLTRDVAKSQRTDAYVNNPTVLSLAGLNLEKKPQRNGFALLYVSGLFHNFRRIFNTDFL